MFDLLKKKISGFITALTQKEQAPATQIPATLQPTQELAPQPKPVEPAPLAESRKAQPESERAIEEPVVETIEKRERGEVQERKPTSEIKEETVPVDVEPIEPQPAPTAVQTLPQKPARVEEEPRSLKPKIGLLQSLTSLVTGKVTIGAGEVDPLLEELELVLLESDVSYDTSAYLAQDLRRRLVGKQINRGELESAVRGEVRSALVDVLASAKKPFDLFAVLRAKKAAGEPAIILFLGPNGAGKTTTIAKLARLLQENGFSVVLAASDSFRSGAIQQLAEHGEKLGVKVIKRDYGSDPTAVAFDAVAHAKANYVDVVLVDTAGRQETNYNLVREMEKMSRVLKPDARLFVGEAIAGHAIIEQVQKFNDAVGGIDGIILTKMDCDAKGGTSLSLARETGIPLVFVGVGQAYTDLKPFDAAWLADNIAG